jgi:hypothetical protein
MIERVSAGVPLTGLRMTDKRDKPDKSGMSADSARPGFVHTILANGLTVSTCQRCFTPIGSPTPASLRMAEENHRCEFAGRPRMAK